MAGNLLCPLCARFSWACSPTLMLQVFQAIHAVNGYHLSAPTTEDDIGLLPASREIKIHFLTSEKTEAQAASVRSMIFRQRQDGQTEYRLHRRPQSHSGADFCIPLIMPIRISSVFETCGRRCAIPFLCSFRFDAAADVSEAKTIQQIRFTRISPIFDAGGQHSIVPSLCSFCFNAGAVVSESKIIQHTVALFVLTLLGVCR